jgi:hypothetical protein
VTVRILEDDDDEYENEDDFSTSEFRFEVLWREIGTPEICRRNKPSRLRRMLQPDPRHRSFNDQRDNPFG